MLRNEAKRIGSDTVPDLFIGIGDNPKADIRGANKAGDNWRSVLVRTGVHEAHENDKEDPADLFCKNVEEAMHTLYNADSGSSGEDGNIDLFMGVDDLISALSEGGKDMH